MRQLQRYDSTGLYHDQLFLFPHLPLTSFFLSETMKRFVIFLFVLIAFVGIYNLSMLHDSIS